MIWKNKYIDYTLVKKSFFVAIISFPDTHFYAVCMIDEKSHNLYVGFSGKF